MLPRSVRVPAAECFAEVEIIKTVTKKKRKIKNRDYKYSVRGFLKGRRGQRDGTKRQEDRDSIAATARGYSHRSPRTLSHTRLSVLIVAFAARNSDYNYSTETPKIQLHRRISSKPSVE